MSHQIWNNRAAFRQHPAWHGLGSTFTEPLNASAAGESGGLFYNVQKLPLEVIAGDERISAPGLFAITRMATDEAPAKIFGTVGNGYELLDNRRIAQILDPLSETFPVESCAALHGGEVAFWSLRSETPSEVGGDEIVNYFVVADRKDGKSMLKILYTPVRVVCQNTLTAAATAATVNLNLPHRRGAGIDLEFYSRLTLEMSAAQDRVLQSFRKMTQRQFDPRDVEIVLEEAFPEPAEPRRVRLLNDYDLRALAEQGISGAQDQVDRATSAHAAWMSKRDRAHESRSIAQEALARFNDEFPANARTGWAVYNACTETSDWRKGRGAVGESTLFGERAAEKVRAYSAIMSLIG